MNEEEKKIYSAWVGFGLIIGAGIGSTLDFLYGPFTGVIAAVGAGLGVVIGSIIGYMKVKNDV